MSRARTRKKPQPSGAASSFLVRMDEKSKRCLANAAALRQMSISEYVKAITVPTARREILAARERGIALTAEEQLEFWNALNEPPNPTPRQRDLGSIARGEA